MVSPALNVPLELWERAMYLMLPTDILSLSMVCRQLHSFASPNIFRVIEVHPLETRSLANLPPAALLSARTVALYNYRPALRIIPPPGSLPLLTTLVFAPELPVSSNYVSAHFPILLQFVQAAPNLRHLDIAVAITRRRDLTHIFLSAPCLASLVLRALHAPELEPPVSVSLHWHNLRELVLGTGVTDTIVNGYILPSHVPLPLVILDVSKGASVAIHTLVRVISAAKDTLVQLHLTSSALVNEDNLTAILHNLQGPLPALTYLHVRMLARRGSRQIEMDCVSALVGTLASAGADLRMLELEAYLASYFYNHFNRGGGSRSPRATDHTGLFGERLPVMWWTEFAQSSLPPLCHVKMHLTTWEDNGDDAPWQRATQHEIERRLTGAGISASVHFSSGLYNGIEPEEEPENSWPEHWMDVFEEEPDDALDQCETPLFYVW
ncbi:hypothetical protein BD626DRAFT_576422 [Schizophyllum amplum]|uniref:F-box domain-containing protein n=1 Tax=Schizophyllum amplum TaxID=97359 RepID=A0A550BTM7_9AGAR|nr:hypothetical protein BD626DRAFT_576422 [Auriculariopsis ampla]